MIYHRVLPHDRRAAPDEPGGARWIPRTLQGAGRHDNPDLYGAMYVSEHPLSPLVEALVPFRGTGELREEMLVRAGSPLAIATLETPDAMLVDLDDPQTLSAEDMRPSEVATRHRTRTQRQAADLHAGHPGAGGLRWWSTLESLWINVTLFDRAVGEIEVVEVRPLGVDDPLVEEAAVLLGLES